MILAIYILGLTAWYAPKGMCCMQLGPILHCVPC